MLEESSWKGMKYEWCGVQVGPPKSKVDCRWFWVSLLGIKRFALALILLHRLGITWNYSKL